MSQIFNFFFIANVHKCQLFLAILVRWYNHSHDLIVAFFITKKKLISLLIQSAIFVNRSEFGSFQEKGLEEKIKFCENEDGLVS